MKHSESLALREIVRAELVRSNPKELTGKYISGQTFAISDLAYRSAIIGRHFEDCHIHGPAVLAVVGIGHLADCRIDGTPESLFITMNQPIQGVIRAEDCIFRNCTFYGVGFIGPQAQKEKFMKSFMKQSTPDTQDSTTKSA